MNFIEYYDNSLKKDYCDFIIKLYKKQNSQSSPTVNGINAKHKLGTHIPLSFENSKGWLNSSVNTYLSNSLFDNLQKYKKKYNLDHLDEFVLQPDYHIQKFEEGGGYFTPHCEHCPEEPNRILVWMIYLNDAKSGTKFNYYNKTYRAKSGRMLMWPAGWTHLHCGVTPNRGDKYIITGWFKYK